jgi:hypothetical protein
MHGLCHNSSLALRVLQFGEGFLNGIVVRAIGRKSVLQLIQSSQQCHPHDAGIWDANAGEVPNFPVSTDPVTA